MPTHYVLVDFENVQPEAEALSFLNDERIKIIIFVNAKQKLSVDRVKVLQPLGDRVEYIEMAGSGKNALDFIIAFYIGRNWSENAESKFYVVSQDTGFDPLLKHLAALRPGSVKRMIDFTKIKKHMGIPTSSSEPPAQPGIIRQRAINICAAIQALPEGSLPGSAAALENFIMATLNDCDLLEHHVARLLNFMTKKELIVINQDGGLIYQSENITAGATGQFISKEPANNVPQKPVPVSPAEELTIKACDDLKKRGNSKPRTLKTLASTIKSIFKGDLSDQQVEAVVDFMKAKKIIAVSNGTKVTYNFDK